MTKPSEKTKSNKFSSGPCSKRSGWNSSFMEESGLLGRSHRSKEVLNLINAVTGKSLELLNVPNGYKIAIISASDTGAFECAMWNLLGPKGIDVIHFEAFGHEWYKDITEQLKLKDVREFSAPFGQLPQINNVDFNRDVVFTLNGTTSGVCLNSLDFIPQNRHGLTLCDATSAVFSIPIDFTKLDVTTYSWQKSLGGEAQHGVMIFSPRAIERLESYSPIWPMPKIFQLKKGEKVLYNTFEGSVINTPSVMCILDVHNTICWIEKQGGAVSMQKKVAENYEVISKFIENSPYFENLCKELYNRSKTSVCFTISELWFKECNENEQRSFINKIASILEEEEVAFDIKGYNSAPPSFRVWCGLTVEKSDIEILCKWFEYAYETAKKSL